METCTARQRRGGLPEERQGEADRLSLCEALDRILNKGAVVAGEVTISVANIDLIYLSLQLILCSIETAMGNQTSESDCDEA